MNPWIALVGPTAVGKTDISQELAKELNGEIISCDSTLFYKGLDIGTAKPKEYLVPHHMIDLVDPGTEFDVADYRKGALQKIEHIQSQQKNVFIVGGAGFYLRALLNGVYEVPQASSEVRENLEKENLESLYEKLKSIDSDSAEKIHAHDRYRIVRALEVFEISGKSLSSIKKEFENHKKTHPCVVIGFNRDREELYNRINKRVDLMLEEGLKEEVENLLKTYPASLKSMQCIGYKQMCEHLQGKTSPDKCREEIAKETRHLAKRQLTWFKNQANIAWFHPEKDREKIWAHIQNVISAPDGARGQAPAGIQEN